MSCLSPGELVRVAEGGASEHPAECAPCTGEVGLLSETIGWLRDLPAETEESAAQAPKAAKRSWKGAISLAASILVFFGILAAVYYVPDETFTPADTSNRSEAMRIEALVTRFVNGENVQDELLALRRSSLPALLKFKTHPRVAALIALIDARTPRVLIVEQSERPEYRHLKDELLNDKDVFVHCLLLDLDPELLQEYSERSDDPAFRQPIFKFPRTMKELMVYNVIILGDVDLRRIGGSGTAHNLHRFVKEFGGGLILLSGKENNPRTWQGTGLARLLPVQAGAPAKLPEGSFGHKITTIGYEHRIFSGTDWKPGELPLVRSYFPVKSVKPGAQTIAILDVKEKSPLFVTQPYGRGRVFWSATDETWRWKKNADFYRLWQRTIDWTLAGKAFGSRRYRVDVSQDEYRLDEKVYISVQAYDTEWNPLTGTTLEVTVLAPSGNREKVKLTIDSGRDGYYEGSYSATETGTFRVEAGDDNRSSGKAHFDVSSGE